MTTTINASTSSGLVATPDNSGSIALQSNGATITTISSTGTSSLGVSNGSSAATGQIGEFVSSLVTGVSCGSNSASTSNLTSITLTAGDWDISSVVNLYGSGAATIFANYIALTNNANTSAATRGLNLIWGAGNSTYGLGCATIPRYRVSISSTTTYYLQTYGNSGDTYDGYISARRIR